MTRIEEASLCELTAISPIDGRYRSRTKAMVPYASEAGLMKYRLQAEVTYLHTLSEFGVVKPFSDGERDFLNGMWRDFSLEDAIAIKKHEEKTNHDVKAVEYFMRGRFMKSSLYDVEGMIHFGLTSYDIDSNAISMMLRDGLRIVLLPEFVKLEEAVLNLAKQYAKLPMLARTHGQPATPTTLGKEFAVFGGRLSKEMQTVSAITAYGKMNGASGNYNAMIAAYPDIDWQAIGKRYLAQLGLRMNPTTTQIEPMDYTVEAIHGVIRMKNIMLDMDQDMWLYIMMDYLRQKPKEGEVGSSTMPHKINPIDFENSEGNTKFGNACLEGLARCLQISRLQRDLSGSAVTRNIGMSLAYSLLAVKSAIRGLGKIYPDVAEITTELASHPEILAEPIQTILRREGIPEAYEQLKKLTRGEEVSTEALDAFVSGLPVGEDIKEELHALTPLNYLGDAPRIASAEVARSRRRIRAIKQKLKI